MGMGKVHVVTNVCVYIMVCQEFLWWSNVHHPMKQFGNPLLILLLLPGVYDPQEHAWKIVHVDCVYSSAFVMHWKGRNLIFYGVIIIRGAVCQFSAYRSESWISGIVWCNQNWVERGILDAGNMVDPGWFLERSCYVEIFLVINNSCSIN